MMNPKLIVNDKAYQIESIDYLEGSPTVVIIDKDGKKVFVPDESISINPHALNLSDAIHFEGRYEPIITAIDTMIEFNQQMLSKGTAEIMDSVMDGKFISDSTVMTCREIRQLIHSLRKAKDVIEEIIAVERG